MPASYPVDRSTYMSKEGPANPQFRILGGDLLYHPKRDGRFPYLYRIPTHTLVHSPDHFHTILIHIVDPSMKARIRCAQFDKTLSVPLGPNVLMEEYGYAIKLLLFATFYNNIFCSGLLELKPGMILFARPLCEDGIYQEENDIVESWCLDG